MDDLQKLDMRLAEIGRVIGRHEDEGEQVPDSLLIESAEIEMAMEALRSSSTAG